MRMHAIWLTLAPLACLASSPETRTFQCLGKAQVGKPAPFFSGYDTKTGTPVNTRTILARPGYARHLVVSFQTTCAPCLKGLKELDARLETFAANRISITLVGIGESEEILRPWLARQGLEFPALADPYGRSAATALGATTRETGKDAVTRLPVSLLMDSTGTVLRLFGQEGPDWIDLIVAPIR